MYHSLALPPFHVFSPQTQGSYASETNTGWNDNFCYPGVKEEIENLMNYKVEKIEVNFVRVDFTMKWKV